MNILDNFDYISGVRHACMINNGEVTGSTFPDMMADCLLSASRIMEQMLAGIQSLGEEHNELHLTMEEGQLLGFSFGDSAFLLLMTDLDINQALINTSVRSSKQALLQLSSDIPTLDTPVQSTSESNLTIKGAPQSSLALSKAASSMTAKSSSTKPNAAKLSDEMKVLLKKIAKLLAEQVGPAATVLFRKVYAKWMQESQPSVERTRVLTKQLSQFIENEEKRARFLARTNHLIDQETAS